MKILKVQLSNLNSLKGEHVVDFTQEPLASAGIFAITGPTGAGKTTLLDAITLALYGKVARYGNDANPPDVMTRGTASCRAEVTFEVKKGVFVAQWSLARARGALEGNVQPVRRALLSSSGRILAEQVRAVNEKVEELLGLDHDRFMRSAMLAQGQFARFLTSKPDERAQLLESLTGSEVYSQIGAMVFEEAGRVEQGILDREARMLEIALLADEEAQRLRDEVAALEQKKVVSRDELQGLSERKARIAALESAQKKAAQESARLGTAEQEAGRHAAEFRALAAHQATLPFTEVLTRLDGEQAALEEAVAEDKAAKEGSDAARKELSAAAASYAASIERELEEAEAAKAVAAAQREAAEARAEAAQAWLKAHRQDERLGATLGQLSKLLAAQEAAEGKLDEAWEDWKAASGSLLRRAGVKPPAAAARLGAGALAEHVDAVKVAARAERDEAATARDEAQEALDRAHEVQKAALLVQKYEKDRATLRDGEPCPLCGSTKHPHASRAPARDRMAGEVRAAQEALDSAGRQATQSATRCAAVEQSARRLVAAHQQALARLAECEQGFRAAGHSAREDVEALQARANKHAEAKEKLAAAQATAKEAGAAVDAATRQLAQLRKRKSTGLSLPGGVKAAARGDASLDIDEAEEAFHGALSAFKEAQAVLAGCTRRLKEAQAGHAAAVQGFERKLAGSGFKDAKAVQRARLADRDAERIARTKQALDKRISDAKALLAGARDEVERLVASGVPQGREAEKVKARHDQLVDEVEAISAAITDRRRTLSDDALKRKEKARLEKELQAERVEVEVWRKLRELVGSKDGAKFRKFAQSITLQILTRHANRHLARLNDRYALLLQEGDSLELQIEDGYQAGARRPLTSLSGGESFLASLALALGLSDLAGRTVNIDTLFIDEGFGSLDPETLDVALTALEALRQGNKSVGVISHVGLLKERIHTQIVVHKGASGHSTLVATA